MTVAELRKRVEDGEPVFREGEGGKRIRSWSGSGNGWGSWRRKGGGIRVSSNDALGLEKVGSYFPTFSARHQRPRQVVPAMPGHADRAALVIGDDLSP